MNSLFDIVVLSVLGLIALALNLKFIPDAIRILVRKPPRDARAVHLFSSIFGRFLSDGVTRQFRRFDIVVYLCLTCAAVSFGIDFIHTLIEYLKEI